MKKSWDFLFDKFLDAIKTRSPRGLRLLGHFFLSRVYYVASILPINKTMVNKFEKQIGKFLWTSSGKVLRVSIDELKNSDRGDWDCHVSQQKPGQLCCVSF